jgi:Transcription factor WhiB
MGIRPGLLPPASPPISPDWRRYAECANRSIDPQLFDPPHYTAIEREVIDACRACRVSSQCLAYAMATENRSSRGASGRVERHGIWGGYTPRGRHEIAKGNSPHPIWSLSYSRTARTVRRSYGGTIYG